GVPRLTSSTPMRPGWRCARREASLMTRYERETGGGVKMPYRSPHRPLVRDHLAVVGQFARSDQLHDALELGDRLQGGRDRVRERSIAAHALGQQRHGVLLALAA